MLTQGNEKLSPIEMPSDKGKPSSQDQPTLRELTPGRRTSAKEMASPEDATQPATQLVTQPATRPGNTPTITPTKPADRETLPQRPLPSTPRGKSNLAHRTKTQPPGSAPRPSLMSYVSDSDSDELSLQSLLTPRGSRATNTANSSGGRRVSSSRTGPYLPSLHTTPPGSRVRSSAKKVRKMRPASWAVGGKGSPAGSPVRTPGGTMRRCGVEGFSCDRDFCFTCG